MKNDSRATTHRILALVGNKHPQRHETERKSTTEVVPVSRGFVRYFRMRLFGTMQTLCGKQRSYSWWFDEGEKNEDKTIFWVNFVNGVYFGSR